MARRAPAFGMEVIAVDPESVDKPDFVREVWGTDRFYGPAGAVRRCLSVLSPHAEDPRLFDREAFRHMKPQSLLINRDAGTYHRWRGVAGGVGTGTHLRRGPGRNFPGNLCREDSPLWDHPHVIITPTPPAAPRCGWTAPSTCSAKICAATLKERTC